jgi:hypothetical protein
LTICTSVSVPADARTSTRAEGETSCAAGGGATVTNAGNGEAEVSGVAGADVAAALRSQQCALAALPAAGNNAVMMRSTARHNARLRPRSMLNDDPETPQKKRRSHSS